MGPSDLGTPESNPAGADRDKIAEDRDERADAHDEESDARDERADARDERALVREGSAEPADAGAAADRAGALRDRRGGASDRVQAADDREAASADRAASARERAISSIDDLTGAYRRDAGIVELEREVSRARRTGQPLTLAFIDVDGLKEMNDSAGHAAGDELLRETAASVRTHFRPYDLAVRYGGDEFLCGFWGMTPDEADARFLLVNEDLGTTRGASITVGLAALQPDDTLEELIGRADEAMYLERQLRRPANT